MSDGAHVEAGLCVGAFMAIAGIHDMHMWRHMLGDRKARLDRWRTTKMSAGTRLAMVSSSDRLWTPTNGQLITTTAYGKCQTSCGCGGVFKKQVEHTPALAAADLFSPRLLTDTKLAAVSRNLRQDGFGQASVDSRRISLAAFLLSWGFRRANTRWVPLSSADQAGVEY
jgi:hypothetical protein